MLAYLINIIHIECKYTDYLAITPIFTVIFKCFYHYILSKCLL